MTRRRLRSAAAGLFALGLGFLAVGAGLSISLADIGAVTALVAWISLGRAAPRPAVAGLAGPAAAYIAIGALAAVRGAAPWESLYWSLKDDSHLLILVVASACAAGRARRLGTAFLVSSALAAGLGILQWGLDIRHVYPEFPPDAPRWVAGLPEGLRKLIVVTEYYGRTHGPRDIPITYAEGLAFAVAVAAARGAADGRWGRALGLCGLFLAGIATSQTRMPFLAAVLVLGLSGASALPGRRRWLAWAAAAGVVLAVVWLPGGFAARLRGTGGGTDLSFRYRLHMWRTALDIVRDHPLGVGQGNTSAAYQRYGARRSSPGEPTDWGDVHSAYLEAVVERGVPGLAALAWLMAAAWRRCRAAADAGFGEARAGEWAVVAMAACGLTESVFTDDEIIIDLWFVLALAFAAGRPAPAAILGVESFGKTLQRVAAALLLIGLSPCLLLVAMGVALTSRGPVLYQQRRIGLGGRPFTLYKFRTMYRSATPGEGLTAADDPRVTSFGRWLRRHRLDELPQLINVLRGEMRMVGPRPDLPESAEALSRTVSGYAARWDLRPGITGLAQIRSPYGARPGRTLRYDRLYARRRHPALDFWIQMQTVRVMWGGLGAR